MSNTITIKFKDGTEKTWSDSRAGGSYFNELRFDPGFVTVVDVWGNKKSYPSDTVAEIVQPGGARGW